jgi:hypothetical protein
MKYSIVLMRVIQQSATVEVEAKDVNEAKAMAMRQHAEGLDWDDDAVVYGPHEAHGGGRCVEFFFDE